MDTTGNDHWHDAFKAVMIIIIPFFRQNIFLASASLRATGQGAKVKPSTRKLALTWLLSLGPSGFKLRRKCQWVRPRPIPIFKANADPGSSYEVISIIIYVSNHYTRRRWFYPFHRSNLHNASALLSSGVHVWKIYGPKWFLTACSTAMNVGPAGVISDELTTTFPSRIYGKDMFFFDTPR